jgi:hypothetical protein
MEEKYEIIDDEVDDVELEKEESHPMTEIPKEVEANQSQPSKVLDSKRSDKKRVKGTPSKISDFQKIKSDNSIGNKSIGLNSLNTTIKKTVNNLKLKKSQTSSVSFGERLYRKAVALKEMKEKKTTDEIKTKESLIKRECSFTPKINDESFLKKLKKTYDRSVDSSFATAKPKKEIESYFKKKEEQDLSELK